MKSRCFILLNSVSKNNSRINNRLAYSTSSDIVISPESSTLEDNNNTEVTLTDQGDPENTPKKYDISRLRPQLKSSMEHYRDGTRRNNRRNMPRNMLKRHLAWYGEESGVDPKICWPTSKELQEIQEYEAEFEPSLQELFARRDAKHKEDQELRMEREEHVSQQMEKMPEIIAAYKNTIAKRRDEEKRVDDKRKVLLEEARDYFGFTIDVRDPRFIQMKEDRDEAEISRRKEKKKAERELKKAAIGKSHR